MVASPVGLENSAHTYFRSLQVLTNASSLANRIVSPIPRRIKRATEFIEPLIAEKRSKPKLAEQEGGDEPVSATGRFVLSGLSLKALCSSPFFLVSLAQRISTTEVTGTSSYAL